jgi:hypothetical protein
VTTSKAESKRLMLGMARAIWMVAYAGSEAHGGEADRETVSGPQDLGWLPAAPPIAKKAAEDLYELFTKVNKRGLDKIWKEEIANLRKEGANNQDLARAHMGHESYGWYMAMAALGNESWFTWYDDLTVETAVPTFYTCLVSDQDTENGVDHLNWEGSDKVRTTIDNAFTHAEWAKKNRKSPGKP